MPNDNTERLADTLNTSIDWKRRMVYITGPVEDVKVEELIPAIRMLDETKGVIKVVLFSPGGSETGGYAIYDTLTTLRNKVYVFGFGSVYSIAAIILQAGCKRMVSANSQLMLHHGSMEFTSGDVKLDDISRLAKEGEISNFRYSNLLAQRSGTDIKLIEKWCKEETYFSAEETVRAGLADGIIVTAKDME
jgi:ATP-dependent Clp protease protease subunit